LVYPSVCVWVISLKAEIAVVTSLLSDGYTKIKVSDT
jgi:hypothetical protein